jgi:hypothetical protein
MITQVKVRRVRGPRTHWDREFESYSRGLCMCVVFCTVPLFECRLLAFSRYQIQGSESNVKLGIGHFLKNLLNRLLIWRPERVGTLFCGAMLWLQQSGSRGEEKDFSYNDLKCSLLLTCVAKFVCQKSYPVRGMGGYLPA